MAAALKQYECKVVQAAVEYDNFLYIATLHPEYERDGLDLTLTGRYHVVLLWPLGTIHFMVYKDKENDNWDIDEVEEETESDAYPATTNDREEENINPLSLEAIMPDIVLQTIGNKIETEYV